MKLKRKISVMVMAGVMVISVLAITVSASYYDPGTITQWVYTPQGPFSATVVDTFAQFGGTVYTGTSTYSVERFNGVNWVQEGTPITITAGNSFTAETIRYYTTYYFRLRISGTGRSIGWIR